MANRNFDALGRSPYLRQGRHNAEQHYHHAEFGLAGQESVREVLRGPPNFLVKHDRLDLLRIRAPVYLDREEMAKCCLQSHFGQEYRELRSLYQVFQTVFCICVSQPELEIEHVS